MHLIDDNGLSYKTEYQKHKNVPKMKVIQCQTVFSSIQHIFE